MGKWRIVIEGEGPRLEGQPSAPDEQGRRLAAELRNAGQRIDEAYFQTLGELTETVVKL